MNLGQAIGLGTLTFMMLIIFFCCMNEIFNRVMNWLHKKKG